eukprot:scaffold1188_cov255-Pinguiococcus_pyrenoidosus.AAC.7
MVLPSHRGRSEEAPQNELEVFRGRHRRAEENLGRVRQPPTPNVDAENRPDDQGGIVAARHEDRELVGALVFDHDEKVRGIQRPRRGSAEPANCCVCFGRGIAFPLEHGAQNSTQVLHKVGAWLGLQCLPPGHCFRDVLFIEDRGNGEEHCFEAFRRAAAVSERLKRPGILVIPDSPRQRFLLRGNPFCMLGICQAEVRGIFDVVATLAQSRLGERRHEAHPQERGQRSVSFQGRLLGSGSHVLLIPLRRRRILLRLLRFAGRLLGRCGGRRTLLRLAGVARALGFLESQSRETLAHLQQFHHREGVQEVVLLPGPLDCARPVVNIVLQLGQILHEGKLSLQGELPLDAEAGLVLDVPSLPQLHQDFVHLSDHLQLVDEGGHGRLGVDLGFDLVGNLGHDHLRSQIQQVVQLLFPLDHPILVAKLQPDNLVSIPVGREHEEALLKDLDEIIARLDARALRLLLEDLKQRLEGVHDVGQVPHRAVLVSHRSADLDGREGSQELLQGLELRAVDDRDHHGPYRHQGRDGGEKPRIFVVATNDLEQLIELLGGGPLEKPCRELLVLREERNEIQQALRVRFQHAADGAHQAGDGR